MNFKDFKKDVESAFNAMIAGGFIQGESKSSRW